jgi:transcription initiation factor TFIID subunit 11
VVAGFAKVFVGEMVERGQSRLLGISHMANIEFYKARQVQARLGEPPDTPLSPEHIREAYRLYQEETGKVGAARVHKGRRLFVR